MPIRVGINGFGRIGRNLFRASLGHDDLDIVSINDITDSYTLSHLLKYDSTFGVMKEDISASDGSLNVGGKKIIITTERDPSNIPWGKLDVDVVVESTGLFTKRKDAQKHIEAGARKVVISAPADGADITIVLGVNEEKYNPKTHQVISNASCTTNCLAPLIKVIKDEFGIVNGFMTTIHSYTSDQALLDSPHKDLRRARSAGVSMIPTSTGAAEAVTLVIPELKGKLDGLAVRVPTTNVSLIDLTCILEKDTSVENVNKAVKKASNASLKGILEYCDKPLVSIDFCGNPASSIFDSLATRVIDGRTANMMSWYDNEWGYSSRVRDLVKLIATKEMQ